MKRLRILREEHELSQTEIAKICKVAPSTYGGWELGTRQPDINALSVLADFYGVSIDYIIGRDSNLKSSYKLRSDEIELLSGYRDLPLKLKHAIIHLVKMLR